MTRLQSALCLLLFAAIFTTQKLPAQALSVDAAWLRSHCADLHNGDAYNFSSLAAHLSGKRIVAIGESSHGLGEFYRLKTELVQYLHRELGYEVLAMEGGVGDVNLAWTLIGGMSPEQLRDSTVYGNFRAKEVSPLFQYVKEQATSEKPLAYTGFDTQASSDLFYRRLQQLVGLFDTTLAKQVPGHYNEYFANAQAGMQSDSVGFCLHRDQFMDGAQRFSECLSRHRDEILKRSLLTPMQFDIMMRTLRSFSACVNLTFERRFEAVGLRDKIMAENFSWLADTLYAGKKIVIWAHNAHIEKSGLEGGYFKWMGHFLHEAYGDAYYSVGIFCHKGRTYQHWDRQTVSFENSGEGYLEEALQKNSGCHTPFLPLWGVPKNSRNAWLFEVVKAGEVENGGMVQFVPTSRFDALICIPTSDIPTFK